MSLPLLLIHAFPFDQSMWRPQAEFLRARGHRVITPDLPGFGAAPAWPREQCSIEAFAGVIHDVIVRQADGRAIVGGLSLGGYVVLALLRKFPESVAAAMLMDTRAEADTYEARAARLAAIDMVRQRGVEPLADTMLGRVFSRHASPALRIEARETMLRQSPAGVMGAQWAMAQRPDQTSLLEHISVPTLVLAGADDAVTPPSVAMGMHTRIAGSMLVQIANAGHMSNLEAPDAVNQALEHFVATV